MTDMWPGGTLLNENPSMNCHTTLHRDNHNSLKEELCELFLGAARNRAFENSRFSSLLTSPAAKSEEKQLFSHASGIGHLTKKRFGGGDVIFPKAG